MSAIRPPITGESFAILLSNTFDDGLPVFLLPLRSCKMPKWQVDEDGNYCNVRFDVAEDYYLMRFLATNDATGVRRCSKGLYALLGPEASPKFAWSRHRSAASWMARYRNKRYMFDREVKRYTAQHSRSRVGKTRTRLPTAPPTIKTVGFGDRRAGSPISYDIPPTNSTLPVCNSPLRGQCSTEIFSSPTPAFNISRANVSVAPTRNADSANKILALENLRAYLMTEKARAAALARASQLLHRGELAQPPPPQVTTYRAGGSKGTLRPHAATKPYERVCLMICFYF
ncbi:hypothetical protein K438DRAFT_586852 [Mycena galopus ATCC 62051]|nr:hypothetical protein K438DRAFT_586852 [Mycena galopus ATCC 62051]